MKILQTELESDRRVIRGADGRESQDRKANQEGDNSNTHRRTLRLCGEERQALLRTTASSGSGYVEDGRAPTAWITETFSPVRS